MVVYGYILKCSDNTHYSGITKNLVRRMLQHASGYSGYTRLHRAVMLSYLRPFPSYRVARRWEVTVKSHGAKRLMASKRFNAVQKNFLVSIPLTHCPLALTKFQEKL